MGLPYMPVDPLSTTAGLIGKYSTNMERLGSSFHVSQACSLQSASELRVVHDDSDVNINGIDGISD